MKKSFNVNSLMIRVHWILACLAVSGCGVLPTKGQDCQALVLPTKLRISAHSEELRPRRIVIVTTHDLQDRLKEQRAFAEALASHLARSTLFDVVVARDPICREQLPLRSGLFDEQKLVELSHAYTADTVLYCEADFRSPYAPMQFEAQVLMVNVAQAIAIVALNGEFNLENPEVRRDFSLFADPSVRPTGDSSHLNSPSRFINYAGSRIALSIESVWSRNESGN